MELTMRAYQNEEDYWCIREFLREVSLLNNRHDFAWSLLRWDYWRWHVNENIFHFDLCDVVTSLGGAWTDRSNAQSRWTRRSILPDPPCVSR